MTASSAHRVWARTIGKRRRAARIRRAISLGAAGVVLLVAGGLVLDGRSTKYFVAPTGSDTNPGTEKRPFQTIQHAADVVGPGDTVVVENGVYTAGAIKTACHERTPSRPVVCLTRGGTEDEWITFRARNRSGATIDGENNRATDGFQFMEDANYIRIEGFDVAGMGNASQSGSGFTLYNGGHDVIISGNHIHDIGHLCTDTANGQTGIFLSQPRVTITGNVINDIGRYAPGEQECSPKTNYYTNHDHGIYVNGRTAPGGSDVLISNNVFYGHQRGWAVQVYPGTVANLAILNNTFVGANPYSAGHILLGASTTNSRIINNIFSQPLAFALYFYTTKHANLLVGSNLSSGELARSRPDGVAFMSNLEYLDPRVVRPEFRLLPDSPAIDHGQSLREITRDIDGNPRPLGDGWDIGARESTPNALLRETAR